MRARRRSLDAGGARLSGLKAVLLAAGAARRFGGSKLTQPWRGRPLIAGALDCALAAPRRRGGGGHRDPRRSCRTGDGRAPAASARRGAAQAGPLRRVRRGHGRQPSRRRRRARRGRGRVRLPGRHARRPARSTSRHGGAPPRRRFGGRAELAGAARAPGAVRPRAAAAAARRRRRRGRPSGARRAGRGPWRWSPRPIKACCSTSIRQVTWRWPPWRPAAWRRRIRRQAARTAAQAETSGRPLRRSSLLVLPQDQAHGSAPRLFSQFAPTRPRAAPLRAQARACRSAAFKITGPVDGPTRRAGPRAALSFSEDRVHDRNRAERGSARAGGRRRRPRRPSRGQGAGRAVRRPARAGPGGGQRQRLRQGALHRQGCSATSSPCAMARRASR